VAVEAADINRGAKIADAGANSRETARLLSGEMDAAVGPINSDQRRDTTKEQSPSPLQRKGPPARQTCQTKNTEPFIMTDNKERQIERFKDAVSRVGRLDNVHKRKARKTLRL
jgi:hypothetical protein